MKHPAFFDGFEAFLAGLALWDNPECPGQPGFWAWRDGFASAESGEPQLPRPKPPPPPAVEI